MVQRVGPFEVLREIGRGGMGIVFLGRDTRLDRDVAIKALPEHLAADAARLERFEREAKTLAGLSHPNVAGIHGVEEQAGTRYLILELVDGETLADRLDRGPLPADEAIDLAAQIAAGIEAAHEAGVIHRDLKPANIKITPDGVVKVLDFGLARVADDGTSSSIARTATGPGSLDSPTLTSPQPQHSPTIEGVILGTAAYMSPEQARGRRLDRRTDVWSFGVVLYEMLTGTSPFHGETATDSIGAVLHKDLDLDRLPPSTPAHIRRVLTRCLVRDRTRRFRDIGDVRLELLTDDPPAALVTAAGGDRSRRAAFIGWAFTIALAAALAFVLTRPRPPESSIHATILAPDGMRITSSTISPDGQRLILIGDVYETGRSDASFRDVAFARELASDRLRPIEGLSDVLHAAFSPDGRWLTLATVSRQNAACELHRLPSDLSGPATRLRTLPWSARLGGLAWFAWTPASDIAFLDTAAGELVIASAGTGEELRRLPLSGDDVDSLFASFTGPFGDHWIAVGDPVLSTDGYQEDALLIDVRTGEVTRAIPNAGNAMLVDADRMLFARGPQLFATGFDASTRRSRGPLRPVHEGLATPSSWRHGQFSLSDSGVLAHLPGGLRGANRSIVSIGLDFSEAPWSDEQRAFEDGLAISSDGTWIAATVAKPGGLFEIWIAESEGRRFRRLLGEPPYDFDTPRFTADGTTVIASRSRPDVEGTTQIVRASVLLPGPPEVVYEAAAGEVVQPHDTSPDGRWLLATIRDSDGARRIVELSLDGSGEERRLDGVHASAFSVRYAPPGLPLIAYVSTETGQRQIHVQELSDGVLGAPLPFSAEDVIAVGWHSIQGDTAELSYLRTDRTVQIRSLSFDEQRGVRVDERARQVEHDAAAYLNVAIAPGVGGVAIKRGEDEGPITSVDIITNWIDSLDE